MHHLFVGMTHTGKSRMIMTACEMFRIHGKRRSVVCTEDFQDPHWQVEGKPIQFVSDLASLIEVAKKNYRLNLVIEDAVTMIGANPDRETKYLTTDSRHRGHVCFLGVQEYLNFSTTMRSNCDFVYAFNVGQNHADALAREYGRKEFLDLPNIPKGQFMYLDRKRGVFGKRCSFIPKNLAIPALEAIKTEV